LAEEEKVRLLLALKEKEEAQKQAKENQEAMLKKLKKMEDKLLVGTKAMEQALKQEKELQKTKFELEERKKQEGRIKEELTQKEEANLMMEKKFSSQQEEIEDKKKKLQKLYGKYQGAKSELQDVQDEINRERESYQEQIRELTRQLKLKSIVMDNFIPNDEINKIELRAQWSEEIDDWILPNLQLSGNNLRARRPNSAFAVKRPIGHLDLDQAELDEFDGAMSQKIQETLNNALTEEAGEVVIPLIDAQPNVYFVYKEDGIERQEAQPQQPTKEKKQGSSRLKSAMKKPTSVMKQGNTGTGSNLTTASTRPGTGRRDSQIPSEDNFPKAKGLVKKAAK